MELEYAVLGDRIRRARQSKGWTQARLADAVGFSKQAVTAWEKGKRRIYLDDLIRVAEALGKPFYWFLGIESIPAGDKAASVLEQLQRRVEELMVESSIPDLPGHLPSIVETARLLSEDGQLEVLRYVQYLLDRANG